MKTPDFRIKPLPKRLRSTLLSVVLCIGLMIAWYIATLNQPIAPDTQIVYQQRDSFRVELAADGQVTLSDVKTIYRYKVSEFAVRRVVRAFDQAKFLERDVLAYPAGACQLSFSADYRKTAILHACENEAAELRKPLEALETVTRFRAILKADKAVMRDYGVTSAPR